MRAVFIAAVALGLAACQPAAETRVERSEAASINAGATTKRTYLGQADQAGLYRFCDEGRAVYVSSASTGYGVSSSTSVVENAPECAQ